MEKQNRGIVSVKIGPETKEIRIERIAKAISEEVVRFLNETDLPKKISIRWILLNAFAIRKFVENVIIIIKTNGKD